MLLLEAPIALVGWATGSRHLGKGQARLAESLLLWGHFVTHSGTL